MIHTCTQKAKFRRLVHLLRPHLADQPVAVETIAVGLLERLWHLTATDAPRGDIGRLSDAEIFELLGWHSTANLLDILAEAHWLDPHPDHRYTVHNWPAHAPRFVRGVAARKGGFIEAPKPPAVAAKQKAQTTKPTAPAPKNQAPPPTVWSDVRILLTEAGVDLAKPLTERLEASPDIDLATALAILDHYHQHPHRWHPGALYRRLHDHQPGQAPDAGWPDPDTTHADRQRAHQKTADYLRRQQAEAAERQKATAEAQHFADIEARHGPTLDALKIGDVRRLVRELFNETTAKIHLENLTRAGNRPRGVLRRELLEAIANKKHEAPTKPRRTEACTTPAG